MDLSGGVFDTRSDERRGTTVSAGTNFGLYLFLGERFSLETNLGNVLFTYRTEEVEFTNQFGIEERNGDNDSSSINLNFINEISFDPVFVINFFF